MTYKQEIERLGLKKKHLAKILNVHDSQFSKYINNKIDMPLHVEIRLKALLNTYNK